MANRVQGYASLISMAKRCVENNINAIRFEIETIYAWGSAVLDAEHEDIHVYRTGNTFA